MRRLTPANVAAGALVTLALSACVAATSQLSPVDTEQRALIYGHIDAPKPVQAVELAKMLSPRRPKAHVLENGDFFFEDVAPGDYGLLRFMAGGEWFLLLTGDKENNRRFIVKATPGGMHYVGSWRVTGQQNNRFTPDRFTIDRVEAPGRQALLQRLRPALAGSGWEQKGGAAKSAAKAGARAGATPAGKPKPGTDAAHH